MSKIDNNNTLLREQLGKGDVVPFTAASGLLSNLDFYCIHFPIDSEIKDLTLGNAVLPGENPATIFANLPVPAGTTLMFRVTSITLTSGLCIGYNEHDRDITA